MLKNNDVLALNFSDIESILLIKDKMPTKLYEQDKFHAQLN